MAAVEKPKAAPMPASTISQPVEVREIERFLMLQYIANTVVKGFDKNRKRKDIWGAVVGDWDWDEKVKTPPKKEEFDKKVEITFTRSLARNIVELIKEVLEESEYWNGLQASEMLELHDRLAFVLNQSADD
jgi:hypothetical protein